MLVIKKSLIPWVPVRWS